MQRFTLIHDGSNLGWQTAYLAFNIAARLGAPLLALLVDSATDKTSLAQRAAQIEVGGRAAGVAIVTRLVADFSVGGLADTAADSDGLFVPHRLIPDRKTALKLFEVFHCPIWVVSHETEACTMAVLVSNWAENKTLLSFATTLFHRLQQPLIGLIPEGKSASMPPKYPDITWIQLPDLSPDEINVALDHHNIDILFLPASKADLIKDLDSNCVLYPGV